MIGRLNHVAIVVPDLAWAAALYRDVLGAEVSAPNGKCLKQLRLRPYWQCNRDTT